MHKLPELEYEISSLSPLLSAEAVEFHYNKHHKNYVENLNKLTIQTPFESLSLEDIVRFSSGAIFNNAAQTWNHNFYWKCLSPDGGKNIPELVIKKIETEFESINNFKAQFSNAALSVFGSGWAWLVLDQNKNLQIITTPNADTPLQKNLQILLACDVWEHAYYIDYRNARNKYLEVFWDLVNWNFVLKNLEK